MLKTTIKYFSSKVNKRSPENQLKQSYLLILPLILFGLLIQSCTNCNACLKGEELWNGKYAEGVIFLQSIKQSDGVTTGIIKTNLSDSHESNQYLCLYKRDQSDYTLGQKVYFKAKNVDGIPIATKIQSNKPDPNDLTNIMDTPIVEHFMYKHGFDQNQHKITHIIKGTSDYTVRGLQEYGFNQTVITPNDPLYTKAEAIFVGFTVDSLEIFIETNNSSNLIDIDNCHRHFNSKPKCLN